ncbi:hypothetical protein PL10110_830021 [Planktothrix agardhii]|nr:hypothetical protein PL10110_830021 [Planktothrix agardhii]
MFSLLLVGWFTIHKLTLKSQVISTKLVHNKLLFNPENKMNKFYLNQKLSNIING